MVKQPNGWERLMLHWVGYFDICFNIMVSEKLKILFGKAKKRFGEIKTEDIATFALKEAAGSIPVFGQYIKDAFEEFSPDEKLELLQELKSISEKDYAEISIELGVSVDYLKDIKTFHGCSVKEFYWLIANVFG